MRKRRRKSERVKERVSSSMSMNRFFLRYGTRNMDCNPGRIRVKINEKHRERLRKDGSEKKIEKE